MTDTPEESRWQRLLYCGVATPADRHNQHGFLLWAVAWAITFVSASALLESGASLNIALKALLVIVPNVFGVLALLAYLRFLRMTDELVRKIQLEGLALGFGAGVLFANGYALLADAGAPPIDAGDPVALMMVVWALGQLYGTWRYR